MWKPMWKPATFSLLAFVLVATSFGGNPALAQARIGPHPGPDLPAPTALDPGELREYQDQVVPRLGVSLGELDGMELVDPDGEEIGEVDAILVDPDGQVVAVTVTVGGFLSIGEREAIVGLDDLVLPPDRNKLTVALTRRQLEQLPTWGE